MNSEIRVYRYRPSFVDMDERNEEIRVATVADLLAIDWVQNFATVTGIGVFHRFSLAGGVALIAEYDGGAKYWTIANLESDVPIDLPVWVPVKKEVQAG